MKVEIYCDELYPFYGVAENPTAPDYEPKVDMTQSEWEYHQHCLDVFHSWQTWLAGLRHGPRGVMENETQ